VGRRRRARHRPGEQRERLRGLPDLPLDRARLPRPAGDLDRLGLGHAVRERPADRPVRPGRREARLLAAHGGNISRAAKAAGKDRRSFQRLISKYSLDRKAFEPPLSDML